MQGTNNKDNEKMEGTEVNSDNNMIIINGSQEQFS